MTALLVTRNNDYLFVLAMLSLEGSFERFRLEILKLRYETLVRLILCVISFILVLFSFFWLIRYYIFYIRIYSSAFFSFIRLVFGTVYTVQCILLFFFHYLAYILLRAVYVFILVHLFGYIQYYIYLVLYFLSIYASNIFFSFIWLT